MKFLTTSKTTTSIRRLESAIAQKKNERIVTALNDPEQNILHTYRYALENKKDGLRNEMRGELATRHYAKYG